MPEPPSGTKCQWIASYQEQSRLEEEHLASMSSGILPEYDILNLTSIDVTVMERLAIMMLMRRENQY
eukprot:1433865-Ditylum_brightwellii.AAC.1